MNERTALIWTARWTMVLAVVAVATLVVTSCQNRALLNHSIESAKNAAEHAARSMNIQADQFAAERRSWEESLAEAKKDRELREKQFDTQLALSKSTFEERQKQWNEEREERQKMAYEQRKPHLAPLQCCNYQVAIILEEPINENRPSIRLPYTDEDKARFPSQFNTGFVVRIKNLGMGPAAKVMVNWHVNTAIYRDGAAVDYSNGTMRNPDGTVTSFDVEDYEQNLETLSDTVPNHVLSGGEVEIRHLPVLISFDHKREIRRVEGKVEFACYDLAGDAHRTEYPFFVETNYEGEMIAEAKMPPSLHVHIEDRRDVDELFPRRVARPTVEPDQVLESPTKSVPVVE